MEEIFNEVITNSDLDIIQSPGVINRRIYRRDLEIDWSLRLLKRYPDCIISSVSSGDCSICLETIEILDKIYRLDCGHIFHLECLDKWNKNTCPYCRRDIV
jgi:hypothetical protein